MKFARRIGARCDPAKEDLRSPSSPRGEWVSNGEIGLPHIFIQVVSPTPSINAVCHRNTFCMPLPAIDEFFQHLRDARLDLNTVTCAERARMFVARRQPSSSL